jgi:hypothetical protein
MRLSPLVAFALAIAVAPRARSADDDARRAAHEAVRSALLERATLPTRPPTLPVGTTMEPGARAERARRAEAEQRSAHERAVRRGEQHRARHVDGDHDPGDGPHHGGMQGEDSASDCREAAGDMRTREMHGGMDGGHTGGSDGGSRMGGR